jgi:hypothetical protein
VVFLRVVLTLGAGVFVTAWVHCAPALAAIDLLQLLGCAGATGTCPPPAMSSF